MFNKMIAQQTAKKEKLLDNFLKKHEAEYPFPEDVELICDIDYMGRWKALSFHGYLPSPKNYEGFFPPIFTGNTGKKSSFYPYINRKTKKLSETCHRHFWSQLTEILFEITADSMQKR